LAVNFGVSGHVDAASQRLLYIQAIEDLEMAFENVAFHDLA